MEQPTRTDWPTDVATAVGTGLITTLFPMHRASRRTQWAIHGGFAVLAAAATAVGVQRSGQGPGEDRPSPAVVAAIAGGVGVLTAAGSRGGQAADAWVERSLAARGIRRPRVWIGVAAAALTFGSGVVERRRAARADDALEDALDGVQPVG